MAKLDGTPAPTTQRMTQLDEGQVRFHHQHEDSPQGPRRSTLSFAPKSGLLVLEERGPGAAKRTLAFELSRDEADTLREALALARVRRAQVGRDPENDR